MSVPEEATGHAGFVSYTSFGGGVLRYPVPSGSFSLIIVGNGFHCLRGDFLYSCKWNSLRAAHAPT